MAGSVQRLLWNNLVQAAASVLIASGSQAGFPVRHLRNQLRSATWRTPVGWVITDSNNKIDFDRAGVKVATIANGTYATGAALATAIVTALEAADATPVWACSYSVSTFKFTISSDLSSQFLFGNGTNKAKSVALDIGFAETDTASQTSHTGGNAAYQSRHAINVDLGSAQAVTAGIVINHNVSGGGTVKQQFADTSLASEGYGAGSPTVDNEQTLTGDATIRILFHASQSYRYLRLLITDVQNSVGYGEVGVWFAGTYLQPGRAMQQAFTQNGDDRSVVERGDSGAFFQDKRTKLDVFAPEFRILSKADKVLFEAMEDALGVGGHFFLALDPVTNPASETRYVVLAAPISYPASSDERYTVALSVIEAG